VSYTAPTGAGKTIVMSALIESILFGDDTYPDQLDAIFVWLSDSPELNQQSKDKIDLKADKITLDQCTIIADDSFDQEMLDDGKSTSEHTEARQEQ
jgi:type III restriction enzyme